jgi:uncharacterized protein (TIGR02147 family)
MQPLSIFDYLEYRTYLRDFYEKQKRETVFFSYRYFGNRVGIDSSSLVKIIQGKLHISAKSIPGFVDLCGFNRREAEYFEALVHFNKARTEKESRLYFEKMLSLNDVSAAKIEEYQYEFFQKWYYSAVCALLEFHPVKRNFKELGETLTPSISAREAKQAVKLLEKLGLAERDEQGRYRDKGGNLTTGKEWRSLAIARHQKEMIKLAGDSLERFTKEERDISTLTMNITSRAMPEIKECIHTFRKAMQKLINSYPESDRVFQLNIQLFPLTREKRK